MEKITEKQKIFCDEYLIDLNGTRAYKTAYPHVKSDGAARACASKLLTKGNIKAYIDEQLEKLHSEKVADVQEVMEYLTAVLRGESKAEIVVFGSEGAERMDKAPDEKEKLKAAELLGKRLGMWKDRVEVSGLENEKSKLDNLIEQMTGGGADE